MSTVIDDAIYTRLTTYETSPISGLVALVGPRVYMVNGPDNPTSASFPMVVFGRVNGRADTSINGSILLRESEYEFHCLAATHAAARDVAEEVIAAMQGYQAGAILASELSGDEDHYEPEVRLHDVTVRFTIKH